MSTSSSITTERIGRRTYFRGETFSHKEAIKNAGGHWDKDQRAWWIGSDADAQALVTRLNNTQVMVKATASYRKLPDDTWGVRGKNLTVGGTVTVFKASGEKKEEVVDVILSTDGEGWQTATLRRSTSPRKGPGRGRGRWHTDGEKNYHGHQYSPNDPRYYSSGQYDDES